ncbi:hypothetical protein [Pedobacter mucosus]|uniref:hypothetical protein n=1 Tax=Pedobacter mucosus TaxID=2895286 RepID=UPI001EE46D57|nr:hypothetical protein [Pedobacter mucosus]UKT62803.1 hypothetical protein LOK61_13635 [Pedobacter mucosus]
MGAYKFKTKVSENGTIVIPDRFNVKNKEIEVIISDDINLDKPKKNIKEFLDKFSGILEGIDPDKAKYDYLMEKHK